MKITKEVQKRFDKIYQTHQKPSWIREEVPSLIKELVRIAKKEKKNIKLLDLGCGNGWLSIYFSKQGFNVTGIDSSRTAIKQAQEKAKSLKIKNLKFLTKDALTFPFKNNDFDIVFDRGLLHHIPKIEWKNYIKNIRRVLKDNGLFFLGAFSDKSVKNGFSPKREGRMWRKEKDETGFWTYDYFFNKKIIKDTFGKYFRIVKFDEETKSSRIGSKILYTIFRKK